jgi:hypothetical protein
MIKTFDRYLKKPRTFKKSLNDLFIFKFNECHSPEDGKFCSDDSDSSNGNLKNDKSPKLIEYGLPRRNVPSKNIKAQFNNSKEYDVERNEFRKALETHGEKYTDKQWKEITKTMNDWADYNFCSAIRVYEQVNGNYDLYKKTIEAKDYTYKTTYNGKETVSMASKEIYETVKREDEIINSLFEKGVIFQQDIPIFRGIYLEEDDGKNLILSLLNDKPVGQNGLSSWTTDWGKAKEFTESYTDKKNEVRIVFETQGVTKSIPITSFGKDSFSEILIKGGQEFKLKEIQEYDIKDYYTSMDKEIKGKPIKDINQIDETEGKIYKVILQPNENVSKFNTCHEEAGQSNGGQFCSGDSSNSGSSNKETSDNSKKTTHTSEGKQLIMMGRNKVLELFPFEKSWDYTSKKDWRDNQIKYANEEIRKQEELLKNGTDQEKKEAPFNIDYYKRHIDRENERFEDYRKEYNQKIILAVEGRGLSTEIVPIKEGKDALSIFTGTEFEGNKLKENTIMSGKDEWIGRTIEEVPEVQQLINDMYSYLSESKYEVGSFRSAAPNEEETGSLAQMMAYYKGPMPSDPNPLRTMAIAYYKGEISPADIKMQTRWEDRKKTLLEEINQVEDLVNKEGHAKELANWEKTIIDRCKQELIEKEWYEKMYDINMNMKRVQFYSQETINSFLGQVQETQRILKDRAIDGKIKLYRGIQGEYANKIKDLLKKENEIEIATYPVSSWTSDLGVAERFANKKGIVIIKEIPLEDILLNHETTPYLRTSDFLFGGDEEYEYIVGSKNNTLKISKDEVQLKRELS